MALSAKLIVQVWGTASTALGGGFNPAGTFATDLAADTNTGNTSAPVVSSASYTFVAGDVGHKLFRQDVAGYAGWYTIASVAGGKATLTASIGSAVLYGLSTTGLNYQRPNGLNASLGIDSAATPTGMTWSVDYSQSTAAKYAYTDAIVGATTTQFTSVLIPVAPNIVGNIFNVTSGGTVQRAEVISTSGTTATCDKSLGTAANVCVGNLGGAISTLLVALGSTSSILGLVAGNLIFVKATGTYTLTATVTVTASVKGSSTGGKIAVEGYTTNPGERDGRPLITTATNSTVLITCSDNDYWDFKHLKLTNTAATRANAFTFSATSAPLTLIDIVCDGCAQFFSDSNNLVHLHGCEVTNANSATGAISLASTSANLWAYGCDIHDNTGPGINASGAAHAVAVYDCIFDTNSIGIHLSGTGSGEFLIAHGCVFVDNTADGIKIAANSGIIYLELRNNVFYGNAGEGINNDDEQASADANIRINRNNAFGNNGVKYSQISAGRNEITLTADPFTSRAGRDFSPNTTAGGGALLRNGGFPAAYPAGTTTNYIDTGIGHADPASGGLLIGNIRRNSTLSRR